MPVQRDNPQVLRLEHGWCACTVDNPLAKARGLSFEIEHGLCACTVDNPLAKARDYLSVQAHKPCSISHLYTDSSQIK